MANRAYLYAVKKDNSNVSGICECNYDIPFVFKILISCNTKMVSSKIFQNDKLIALQGNYEEGVKKLYDFFDRLLTDQELYIDELDFKIKNTRKFFEAINAEYFYLDCAEIYDMNSIPLEEQNKNLFSEINNIDVEIEKFYNNLSEIIIKYKNMERNIPNKGIFLNMRKEKAKQELERIKREINNMLFLDYWTSKLYYDI